MIAMFVVDQEDGSALAGDLRISDAFPLEEDPTG